MKYQFSLLIEDVICNHRFYCGLQVTRKTLKPFQVWELFAGPMMICCSITIRFRVVIVIYVMVEAFALMGKTAIKTS